MTKEVEEKDRQKAREAYKEELAKTRAFRTFLRPEINETWIKNVFSGVVLSENLTEAAQRIDFELQVINTAKELNFMFGIMADGEESLPVVAQELIKSARLVYEAAIDFDYSRFTSWERWAASYAFRGQPEAVNAVLQGKFNTSFAQACMAVAYHNKMPKAIETDRPDLESASQIWFSHAIRFSIG